MRAFIRGIDHEEAPWGPLTAKIDLESGNSPIQNCAKQHQHLVNVVLITVALITSVRISIVLKPIRELKRKDPGEIYERACQEKDFQRVARVSFR
jgi:hypothetical protein